MKISFVGTCQVNAMAQAATRLLPDAIVTAHTPASNEDHFTIADAVRSDDFVITQYGGTDAGTPLIVSALLDAGCNAIYMPVFVFSGFHPDMFYVFVDGHPIESGLGPYHSQIALSAYLLGTEPARAVELYNAHIFAELGHFAAYDQAVDRMTSTFLEQGFNIRPMLRRFQNKQHIFMHTINHPSIQLLERLTVLALQRLDLVGQKVRPQIDLPDQLELGIVGAVFPSIARRLRVFPRNTYLCAASWVAPGQSRDVTIAASVSTAYAHYARYGAAALRSPEIDPIVSRLQALLA